jgi:hypothetical protein
MRTISPAKGDRPKLITVLTRKSTTFMTKPLDEDPKPDDRQVLEEVTLSS